jgi:multidrug efflux system outer membrane protein
MVSIGLTFQRVISRAVFALLWFATVAGSRAGEPGDVSGTMPEDFLPELKAILDSALRRSPQLIAADFEREVGEAKIYLANSARLPNLRGTSEYASNQTSTSGRNSSESRASGFFYRFEAGQAIFHWGALKNQSKAAELSLQAARRNYAMVARDMSGVIRKAYLALTVEKARLRQGRQALAVLRNDLDILEEKKRSGAVSWAAIEGEKLRAREVINELERGESEFASNRGRLARLAGLADLPEEKIADDIPRPVYSEAQVSAMAAAVLRDGAKSTLEYEIYSMKVQEATLRHAVEKTRQLPKVNLGASYSLENNTDVNGNTVNQQAFRRQTVNLNAQWNMFDGLATRGAVREALATKRLYERNLNVKVEQALNDTRLLERSLKLDADLMDTTEVRRANAVEAHRRISQEVELGMLRRTEIERARVGILLAEARSLEIRAQYLNRWSEFVAVAGDDPVISHLSARHAREKK